MARSSATSPPRALASKTARNSRVASRSTPPSPKTLPPISREPTAASCSYDALGAVRQSADRNRLVISINKTGGPRRWSARQLRHLSLVGSPSSRLRGRLLRRRLLSDHLALVFWTRPIEVHLQAFLLEIHGSSQRHFLFGFENQFA